MAKLEEHSDKWPSGRANDRSFAAIRPNINADLVIMATHGRTRVSHLVLGSVAQKVVRESSCPVLTVRMKAVQASVGEELKQHFHCFCASGTARVREIIVERRVPRHYRVGSKLPPHHRRACRRDGIRRPLKPKGRPFIA